MKLLEKIQTKITNLQSKVLPHNQIKDLVFGQQHYGTQEFFESKFGQFHSICLPQFPHYQFLDSNLNEGSFENHVYKQYLHKSWGYLYGTDVKSEKDYDEKIATFIELYKEIESKKYLNDKAIEKPITLCQRADGKYILVHGNHRASIAYHLGIDVPYKIITAEKYLFKSSTNIQEKFGSERLNMPYQSIFLNDKEIVRGRRPDILQRIKLVKVEDIKDKTIIEYGCNIGCNIFSASHLGAKSAVGIDCGSGIISAALKLNAYFSTNTKFEIFDLNTPYANAEPADTTFCFSVFGHLQNRDNLTQTIVSLTKNVLYFEGHAKTQQSDYEFILNDKYFKKIEFLGHNRNRIDSKKHERPFFRCVVK